MARRCSSSDEAVADLEDLVQRDMNDFFEFRMGRASRSLSGTHEGVASSRYRDLVDVVLIAVSTSIDGELLRRAIMTELRLRQIVIEVPLKLPGSNAWRARYGAFLSELPNVDIDSEEALANATRVFAITDDDRSDLMWDPVNRQWQD